MAKWTRQSALEAIQRFMDERGRQPTANEAETCTRYGLPSRGVLEKHFGSFPAAIAAAGGVPLRRGEKPGSRRRIESLAKLDALADELGCTRGRLGRAAVEMVIRAPREEVAALVAEVSTDDRADQVGKHNLGLDEEERT